MPKRKLSGQLAAKRRQDKQGGDYFRRTLSSFNRGRRVISTEIRPVVNELDRANVKIDIGYDCVAEKCGLVLIGQSDFHGTGRSENGGNDRAARTRTTAMMFTLNANSPSRALTAAPTTIDTNVPIPLDVPAAGLVPSNGKKCDEGG